MKQGGPECDVCEHSRMGSCQRPVCHLLEMERCMLVDLVKITTRDGLRLDGMFQSPAQPAPSSVRVDGWCFLHGTGGNFYSSLLFDHLAERLLELGCAVLRVNTRGHDGISTAATAERGLRQGAAYEVVDHCRHDVAAWMDWLRQRFGSRIGLLGHSSGAVKSLYAAAHQPELAPACLIALSPPRLSYAAFCSSAQADEFLETYARAERLVASGQPTALMDVKVPMPFVITAASYLEKYGADERYDFLRFVSRAKCPTLITYGSIEVESHIAFRGVPEAVNALQERCPQLRVELVPGADHFYSGCREEVARRVEAWLKSGR
jgi:pimeloyl-ACP methyl ester carboxylesterase